MNANQGRVIGATPADIQRLPLPAKYVLDAAITRGWLVEKRKFSWTLTHHREALQKITVAADNLHWISVGELRV